MRLCRIPVLMVFLFSVGIANAQLSNPTASEQGLLKLESDARALAGNIGYLTPVSHEDPSKNYLDENFYKKYSSSAFAAVYRDRVFLISAGHVFSEANPRDKIIVWFGERRTPLVNKPETSEVLDLAAIDVTGVYGNQQNAGKFKIATDDLIQGKTPLVLVCNKYHFAVPVRTGFYGGIDEEKGDFKRSYLKLNFPGIGAQGGCSGSPIVDLNNFVRGVLIRSVPSGQIATAVPANVIVLFLENKFFK